MRAAILILLLGACSKKDAPVETKRQPPPTASSASPSPGVSASAAPRTCPEEMTSIAAGTFKLDGAGAEARVEAFCIDTTEVTVGAYAACVSCTPPDKLTPACNSDAKKRADHPVNCVT